MIMVSSCATQPQVDKEDVENYQALVCIKTMPDQPESGHVLSMFRCIFSHMLVEFE